MKKVLLIGCSLCILLLAMSGCGKKSDDTSSLTTSDTMQTIGSVPDNTPAYRVDLTNETGKDITGFSVKETEEADFPENMLSNSEVPVFAAGETRELCYPSESTAGDSSGSAEDKLLTPGYDIKLTFSDEETLILHGFPFSDISEGSIFLEDGVAFIQYTSLSTGQAVSTKEAELAEQQTAASANETSSDTEAPVASTPTTQSSQPNQTATSSAAESLATTSSKPAATTSSAPAVSSVPETPSQQTDDCLGDDGLTW